MDNDGPDAMRKHSFKEGEYRRVEVITGQKRRRDWTAEEKAEILAATMVPGASVTEVARRFSIGPTLVWTWRRVLCRYALKARQPELRQRPQSRRRAGISPRDRLRSRSGGPGFGWKAMSIRKFFVKCWG